MDVQASRRANRRTGEIIMVRITNALILLAVFTSIAASTPALAQRAARYTAPRTVDGRPDLQGVWATAFLTTLERPAGVDHLVASPAQAQALAATLRAQRPSVIDPDVQTHDIQQLARVNGEYRTSVIVDPKDGRMPFTQAGLDLASAISVRNAQEFDGPEQRPLAERCLESLGYAPIRALRVFLPRQIVQTRDHVVILSEDAVGRRMIHLRGEPPPDVVRSVEGYSVGHWEQDTLVVHTTHLRADDPARNVIGRPLLLSRKSTITERFTRVSDRELFYRFTVEDDQLYTQPWTGELSMTKHDVPIYEYGCHEGNYSLANILRGGQAEVAKRVGTKGDGR
jgi:hypothetical protein